MFRLLMESELVGADGVNAKSKSRDHSVGVGAMASLAKSRGHIVKSIGGVGDARRPARTELTARKR